MDANWTLIDSLNISACVLVVDGGVGCCAMWPSSIMHGHDYTYGWSGRGRGHLDRKELNGIQSFCFPVAVSLQLMMRLEIAL